jgi:hypothetical protein
MLTAFGRDVEVVVRPAGKAKKTGDQVPARGGLSNE